MSKKKATMTLKDFHGGSIPSDIPLPSAPGVMVRPSDRGGYDRQTSWGNAMGRPDHRLRPASAGTTTRNFDDKIPFLSNSTQIGRNYDEDERKPLDGTSVPRRTISDESLRALPSCVLEPKIEYPATGRVTNRPATTPGSQYSSSVGSNFNSRRASEVNNMGTNIQGSVGGLNSQNVGGPSGQVISGPYPNAWGVRKEAAIVKDPPTSAWSAADAASKLAHASALDKVSSGRWHSKQQSNPLTDVEVIRYPESESHFMDNAYKNSDNSHNILGGMDYQDAPLVKKVENKSNIEDGINGHSKELSASEKARPLVYMETNERNARDVTAFHPSHGKPTASEHSVVSSVEPSERPKLKLLPRSKPMENLEPPMDFKQVYHNTRAPAHADNDTEPKGMKDKVRIVGSQSGNPVVERPKLHLKPRNEPTLQTERDGESKRNSVFGGARPRELVLKERGIDNNAGKIDDLVHPIYRSIQDSTKTEGVPVHASPRYYEKAENIHIERRMGRNTDRHDQRLDVERSDAQRRNWRNENRMSKRDFDKHHQHKQQQQFQQERQVSPETWRKPVENPKRASSDAPVLRYGKAVSAVELAQAFSKSITDTTAADRVQRGVPSRGQGPFSRLTTGPNSRTQINGY